MSAKIATGHVALSGTAQPLNTAPANVLHTFILRAPVTNQHTLYFGDAGVSPTNGYPLYPGEYFNFEYNNESGQVIYNLTPADVFVVGTASDVACWVQAGLS